MIEHGHSLKEFVQGLDLVDLDGIDGLEDAYAIWEQDYGFGGEIFSNEREFNEEDAPALAAAERAPVSYQQAIAAALRKDGWSVIDDSPSPLLIISRESPTTGRTFSVTVSAKGDPDTPLTWLNGFKKLTEEDAPIRWNLFLALMLTVSTLPVQAFAAESADVQSRMSGTCYVQCVRSAWDGGTLFNLTMPDGQVIQGYCLNPGWPTPVDGNYPFTAVDRGDGTYIVTVATSYITSDINQIHPFDHGHMVGRPPWRTQTVGNAIWAVLRYGKISLHKQSANPGCTDGNALYSLAGAEYGIYSDPGCTQWVATMVTDAAGNATSGDLKTGTYYVKEGKASEGFQVDPTVYTVNVAANATVAVNNGVVYETPINDPAGVIIAKYDGDKSYNANNLPQGSASLEGAEFTVRYYDGFYDTEQQAEASGAPTRTWVFRTNKNGTISLQYSDLVSGDPLYEMNGIRVFPRGTLVIRETKAPDGYNLNAAPIGAEKSASENPQVDGAL